MLALRAEMVDSNHILSLETPKEMLLTFSRLVRLARQRRKWTLDELSERSGVPASTISRLERTGLASTEKLLAVLFALDELSALQRGLLERLRQNELPSSLADLPEESRCVLRVRHKKGDRR